MRAFELNEQSLKKALMLTLQLLLILLLYCENFIVLPYFLSHLGSMSALCSFARENGAVFNDYIENYTCAQIALSKPENIWDLATQANAINTVLRLHPGEPAYSLHQASVAQSRYTPQAILLGMPLTALPLNQAIIAFEFVSFLVAFIGITLLIRRYQQYSKPEVVLFWLTVLAAPSFMHNCILGQYGILIAGLAAIFLLTWDKKNVLVPALCFALTLATKPHRALIMLVMSLAARRFRLLLLTALISVLLLCACAATMGVQTVISYPHHLWQIQSTLFQEKLQSPLRVTTEFWLGLPALFSFVFNHPVGYQLIVPGVIIDSIAMYIIWRKAVTAGVKAYPFAYASSLLVDLLIGPYSPYYDLFLINVAWAVTVPMIAFYRFPELRTNLSRIWFLLFSFYSFASWIGWWYFESVSAIIQMFLLTAILCVSIASFHRQLSFSQCQRVSQHPDEPSAS